MEAIVTVLRDIAVALFGGSTTVGGQTVQVPGAINTFFDWLVSEPVLPFFLIGVGVSLLLLAVRVVKGIFWGV